MHYLCQYLANPSAAVDFAGRVQRANDQYRNELEELTERRKRMRFLQQFQVSFRRARGLLNNSTAAVVILFPLDQR